LLATTYRFFYCDSCSFPDIYANNGIAVISAFVSSPRFFTETLTVSDFKCLPPSSGYTIANNFKKTFPVGKDSFSFVHLGQHDSHVNEGNCGGWNWGMFPAFMVGLTLRFIALGAIHTCQLSKQAKKPFLFRLHKKGTKRLYSLVGLYCATAIVLLSVTISFILRRT
jgi:hypothetical protein